MAAAPILPLYLNFKPSAMAKKRIIVSETEALKTTTKLATSGDIVGGETPVDARVKTVNRKIRSKINNKAVAEGGKFFNHKEKVLGWGKLGLE